MKRLSLVGMAFLLTAALSPVIAQAYCGRLPICPDTGARPRVYIAQSGAQYCDCPAPRSCRGRGLYYRCSLLSDRWECACVEVFHNRLPPNNDPPPDGNLPNRLRVTCGEITCRSGMPARTLRNGTCFCLPIVHPPDGFTGNP